MGDGRGEGLVDATFVTGNKPFIMGLSAILSS